MAGLEREGELKANSRFLVGVVGITVAEGGLVGDEGRWGEGGVTSVCKIEANNALACSLSASDSVGIIRLLEGVEGFDSSIRW